MKRPSRDALLALALFLLLALVTSISVIQEAQAALDQPTLASFSEEPEGARAFWLYLQESGLTVTDRVRSEFAIPDEATVMLMLEPLPGITDDEWEAIEAWIEDGGTLVIAGWELGSSLAMRQFDVQIDFRPDQRTPVAPELPLLSSPLLTDVSQLESDVFLATQRADAVTLLSGTNNGLPVAISLQAGDGRIILTTMPQIFTNQGLGTPGHAEMALNLVTSAAAPGTIWFDEWHHGVRPTAAAAGNWLRDTPAGRALLYVAAVLFLFLVLRGRIFGRPVPLPESARRRAPLEYISGLANLNRRAGLRTAVTLDYHDRLKRQLSQRYRLNPTLPDAEFVETLAQYDPTIDKDSLRTLLAQLSRTDLGENEMIEMAVQAAQYDK